MTTTWIVTAIFIACVAGFGFYLVYKDKKAKN
jgi:hypothetical protein